MGPICPAVAAEGVSKQYIKGSRCNDLVSSPPQTRARLTLEESFILLMSFGEPIWSKPRVCAFHLEHLSTSAQECPGNRFGQISVTVQECHGNFFGRICAFVRECNNNRIEQVSTSFAFLRHSDWSRASLRYPVKIALQYWIRVPLQIRYTKK